MHKYQTFGEYVLVSKSKVIENDEGELKVTSNPTLFTVVANSARVEIYLIMKEAIELLTKQQKVIC